MPETVPPNAAGLAENQQISAALRRFADLLEIQGADGFRVRAYRNAGSEIDSLSVPLREIFAKGGIDALIDLRGIGRGIARAIVDILLTGRWGQLERLQGDLTPEALFMTIPGIGPALADRLVDVLDVDTLEELEAVLRSGKVKVTGIGPRKRQAILASLRERLAPIRRSRRSGPVGAEPPVSLLLEADALYRKKAAAGELRRIAPKRFNVTNEAWLPIMHVRRDAWHLTVLFSNTARAHELGRTEDWVVIYFHVDDIDEGRRTVVTERRGPLAGKRVVRGREIECKQWYDRDPRTVS